MDKPQNKSKLKFALIGWGLALLGTGAFFLSPIVWIALCLAANVFLAASVIENTELKTVSRKNFRAMFSEDEPETVEGQAFRVPLTSVIMAVAAALIMGIVTGSAVIGFFVLLTWGVPGFVLAICVLQRIPFGLSMQTGLLWSSVWALVAGALQVFISSPGFSFQPAYCGELLMKSLSGLFVEAYNLIFSSPFSSAEGVPPALAESLQNMQAVSAEEMAAMTVELLLVLLPCIFAIGMLVFHCILWFVLKQVLIRTSFEVKHMGRLDGYVPRPALSTLYFVFFLVNLFSAENTALQIVGLNVVYVVSAVLVFAGFSLVLHLINTRATSGASRVTLTVVAAIVGLSSCGMMVLLLLGLLSVGRDFRNFGGRGVL